MKDIIRIHLAKIPYDIEASAKRELQAYLHELETYADDPDLLNDVELRITELLAERGTNRNDVITVGDVAIIKAQLGEAREFAGDGSIEPGRLSAKEGRRKLFRDIDTAVVGGVCSGLAAYFELSPLWIRLGFLALFVGSAGLITLLYLLLWIVVPAAVTATDKLQMVGEAVTIGSMQRFTQTTEQTQQILAARRHRLRIWTAALGALLSIAALAAATATGISALIIYGRLGGNSGIFHQATTAFQAISGLCLASGLLLTFLLILAAYAALTEHLSRRILITGAVTILIGLASFGTAVGLDAYRSVVMHREITRNTHTVALKLPDGASSISGLTLDSAMLMVNYVVTGDTPHAELTYTSPTPNSTARVKATLDGQTLHLSADQKPLGDCGVIAYDCAQPSLTIYGPQLNAITATNGNISYSGNKQDNLAITTDDDGDITVNGGMIDKLVIAAGNGSAVSLGSAGVSDASVTVASNAHVELGFVESFTLNAQSACPVNGASSIMLAGVTRGTMTINDTPRTVDSLNLPCLTLTIGGEGVQ